jgi:hypothetical protein
MPEITKTKEEIINELLNLFGKYYKYDEEISKYHNLFFSIKKDEITKITDNEHEIKIKNDIENYKKDIIANEYHDILINGILTKVKTIRIIEDESNNYENITNRLKLDVNNFNSSSTSIYFKKIKDLTNKSIDLFDNANITYGTISDMKGGVLCVRINCQEEYKIEISRLKFKCKQYDEQIERYQSEQIKYIDNIDKINNQMEKLDYVIW